MSQSRFSSQKRVALAGSERSAFSAEATPSSMLAYSVAANGDHTPGDLITVSVIVKRKEPLDLAQIVGKGRRLSREEYGKVHGADPASLALVREFAAEFGLAVSRQPGTDEHYRTLQLTGSREQMEKAFGVVLKEADTAHGKLRVREGAICLPEDLASHVVAVLGLDNRPQARPHFRVAKKKPNAKSDSYTPVQVAELYSFPTGVDASGETIGILELGGGYRTADLTAYFQTLNLPAPTVTAVSVDKGKNTPGNANGADGEVMLDIEVSAAVASGAKVVVYFAPNTDQGFIDAISTAVHDTTNKPGVLSISWGGPESSWTSQSLTALDQACQTAAALGVTITVAAGDNGSSDGGTGNNVDFPASSPHVLACGGTELNGSGSTITSEVVWNEESSNEGATGGGVSTVFALPTWQANAGVPAATTSTGGRGVPDVAGDADPTTGYSIRVDGQTMVIGGTSAVAPLWAGLITLANAKNKNAAGFINPTIYATGAASAFHDITSGNNGSFSAGPGWDACTGLGSPIGTAIAALFASSGTTAPTSPTSPTSPTEPPTRKKHHHEE